MRASHLNKALCNLLKISVYFDSHFVADSFGGSMLGPKYSPSAKKGEIGVHLVSSVLLESLDWLLERTPQECDFGIDGQVHVIDSNRTVTGQTFAVQIKYGDSFLKEETRWGYTYRGEMKHLNYLMNYPLPIFILLCDPKSGDIYWEMFDASKTNRTRSAWKMTIPKTQQLASSKEAILSLLPPAKDYSEELENYWLINKVVTELTDDLHIVIAKEWVESADISHVITQFERLKVSKEMAFEKQGKVELSFFGYDTDPRELHEIQEVVHFCHALVERVPLFFFCNPNTHGFKAIVLCVCNAQRVGVSPSPVRIDNNAMRYFMHLQHMRLNEISNWLGLSELENKDICMPIYDVLEGRSTPVT